MRHYRPQFQRLAWLACASFMVSIGFTSAFKAHSEDALDIAMKGQSSGYGLDTGIKDLLRQSLTLVAPITYLQSQLLSPSVPPNTEVAMQGELVEELQTLKSKTDLAISCDRSPILADRGPIDPAPKVFKLQMFSPSIQKWNGTLGSFNVPMVGFDKPQMDHFFSAAKLEELGVDADHTSITEIVDRHWRVVDQRLLEDEKQSLRDSVKLGIQTEEYAKDMMLALETVAKMTKIQREKDRYASPLAMYLLARRLTNATSEAEVSTALREVSAHWTAEQKLDYGRWLGAMGDQYYDKDRADKGASASGSVDRVGIFNAVFTKTNKAGVCRDIADMMERTYRDMGLKAYTVTYNTLNPHVTVIVQDPKNPKRHYKMNFGLESQAKDDTAAITLQQAGDITTGYYLFLSGEGTKVRVLSERGAMFENHAGGRAQDLDPFWQNQSLFQGSTHLKFSNATGTYFSAVLADGTPVVGLAGSRSSAERDGPGYQHEEGGALAFDALQGIFGIGASHIYGRHRSAFNSPWVPVVGKTDVRFESSFNINADATIMWRRVNFMSEFAGPNLQRSNVVVTEFNKKDGIGELGADASALASFGGQMRLPSLPENTSATLKAATQIGAGLTDVRNPQLTSIRPFHNLSYVSLESERAVTPALKSLLNVTLGLRDLGSQGRIEVGAKATNEAWVLKAAFQGALPGATLLVAPGMQPEAMAIGEARLLDPSLNLSALPKELRDLRMQLIISRLLSVEDDTVRARANVEARF